MPEANSIKSDLIATFKAARRVSTPIVGVSSADQQATESELSAALNGSPRLRWDAIRGLRPLNQTGIDALKRMGKLEEIAANTGNPSAALDFLANVPAETVTFFHNANLFFSDSAAVSQGIANLRDPYKADSRLLVLLGASMRLPDELAQSVLVLDEELPSDEALGAILDTLLTSVDVEWKAGPEWADTRRKAVLAVRGLSAFLAEQTLALSIRRESFDIDGLWARKRAAIGQVSGLTLEPKGPSFSDIRGLAAVRDFEARVFAGENAPEVVVRIDEIEKSLAGSGGSDTSGVSADALGQLLQAMEDRGWTGLLAVGPGGSGKSLVSRAIGSEFGRPVVTLDLGAAKGKFVGESEGKIRAALKTVAGLAGGRRVLIVATCNRLDSLPPELRRRFRQGIWFFDLPTSTERAAIWALYAGKAGLEAPSEGEVADENWTGAEIRNCVEMASDMGISYAEAARFVVPVAKADPDGVRRLRDMADGRFLSASASGVYVMPSSEPALGTRRTILD